MRILNKLNAFLLIIIIFSLFIFSCKEKTKVGRLRFSQTSIPLPSQIFSNLREKIFQEVGLKGRLKEIINRKIIRVCLKENNYPFSIRNEEIISSRPTFLVEGFDVDLARKVGQILNVKINFIFKEGNCDIVFNPSKKENYLITEPYFFSPDIMCNRKGNETIPCKKSRKSINDEWLYLGVPEGDTELKSAIDLIIEHLYESGTYNNIYKKWFKN